MACVMIELMVKGKSFREFMEEQFRKDPELKERLARLKRWSTFWELNPALCRHVGVVAPVSEDGIEQPGVCLTCGADNVLEQGEYPDGEPFTVGYTSSNASTVSVSHKFVFNA